ncbi:DUF4956 domain-containing protein [Aporhodopirellula aestuarii]|uniref:DUF4956 domain-containing protein n=1 Tax=Aporhodopirellula aestuarii TaxID=2950107 RepID=A0ABT0UD81_9BACT|nr:DUF4956 domain-containing protein [Aporhodopirellula aestuarii]MCM2374998.1 DUF4956 domain-containing protein [Aporhodopirellula aestuarii]
MPDWITNVTTTQVDPVLSVLVTRLVLAWFCGCVVAWLASRQRPAGAPDTLTLTLILMSILIAMATQIIGDNIARAFSLVGALSIVRFRTAVPETRDVAFVLAAVVVGMAVGAGQYWVSGIGLVVVGMATQINRTDAAKPNKRTNEKTANRWRLTLVVGLSATSGWEAEIDRFTESHQLISAETTRRGGAMELIYRISPTPGTNPVELIAALNALPTVESVATKEF